MKNKKSPQEPEKMPKDLGIKIGSAYEKMLQDTLDRMREDTEKAEYIVRMNKSLIPKLESELEKEKKRFK